MLVAMNNDGAYRYPSQLDDSERTEIILELRRECSKDVWLCPHCFARSNGRNKHPVSLVNPKAKVIHFRHKSGDRTQECASYRGESDKHLAAKMAIMGHLSKNAQTALIESRRYGENQAFRTPDVAIVSKTGIHSAHEIQVSRITVDKLSERTEALLTLGFNQVHWYLYGGNCKDENVNYLISKGDCYPYRLQFENDGLPLWHPMAVPIVAKKQKASDSIGSSCSEGFNQVDSVLTPKLEKGLKVRLKGTNRLYQVISVYTVRAGSKEITEDYCILQTQNGSKATWKASQLQLA